MSRTFGTVGNYAILSIILNTTLRILNRPHNACQTPWKTNHKQQQQYQKHHQQHNKNNNKQTNKIASWDLDLFLIIINK